MVELRRLGALQETLKKAAKHFSVRLDQQALVGMRVGIRHCRRSKGIPSAFLVRAGRLGAGPISRLL